MCVCANNVCISVCFCVCVCVCVSISLCDTHRQWLVLEQQTEVGRGGSTQGVGRPHLPPGEDDGSGGGLGPVGDGGTFGRGLREAQVGAEEEEEEEEEGETER